MPPKMRVEKGMIRASRSFHGIDPELQVSSEPLPMPDPGGAEQLPRPPEDGRGEDQPRHEGSRHSLSTAPILSGGRPGLRGQG